MDASHPNWWFLTGAKKEIYRLARTSYFACYDEAQGVMGACKTLSTRKTWCLWMPKDACKALRRDE